MINKQESEELKWRNRGAEAIDKEQERRLNLYLIAHKLIPCQVVIIEVPPTKKAA